MRGWDSGPRSSPLYPPTDRPLPRSPSPIKDHPLPQSPSLVKDHQVPRSPSPIKDSPIPRSSSPNKDSPGRAPTVSLRLDNVTFEEPRAHQLYDRLPSPDKAVPPTKGLGGFVQSAMMKRSDSVNKRWSVQAAPGLTRAGSVATGRSNHAHSLSNTAKPSFGPPESQNSSQTMPSPSLPPSSAKSSPNLPEPLRPQTPVQVGQSLNISRQDENVTANTQPSTMPPPTSGSEEVRPSSPSKTMDPRRWSPTKASWLESALTRPESPKPSTLKSNTPTWMADLQRSNSIRRDTGQARDNAAPQPASVEARKLPPVIEAPSRGVGVAHSLAEKKAVLDQNESKLKELPPKITVPAKVEPLKSESIHSTPLLDKAEPKDKDDSVGKAATSISKEKSPPMLKPKPESPKIDFRSNLKSRKEPAKGASEEEAEFKNVFGKLKRTETKNYVAPDVFKNNILRGKAALNLTGGPQKTQRVDEFKESILKKKAAMQAGSRADVPVSESLKARSESQTAVPEALARRKTLNKGNHASKVSLDDPFAITSAAPAVSNTEKSLQRAPLSVLDQGSPRNQPLKEVLPKIEPEEQWSKTVEAFKAKQEHLHSDQASEKRQDVPKPIASAMSSLTKTAQAGGKLAGRLNPDLASLITRGPSPVTNKEVTERAIETRPSEVHSKGKEINSGAELTHMTKTRAKGPKRRLPKAEPEPQHNAPVSRVGSESSNATPAKDIGPSVPVALLKSQVAKPAARVPSRVLQTAEDVPTQALPKKPVTSPKPAEFSKPRSASGLSKRSTESKIEDEKTKPIVAAKAPILTKISSPKTVNETKAPSSVEHSASLPTKTAPLRDGPSNLKSTIKFGGRNVDTNGQSPQAVDSNSAAAKGTTATAPDTKPSGPADKPGWPKTGLGLGLKLSPSKVTSPPTQLTPPPDTTVRAAEPNSESFLTQFFGELPRLTEKGEIDVQAVIVDQADSEDHAKVASVKVWQINADGKKEGLSPERQHILHDDSIYLCVGQFTTAAGSSPFAYLWSGDNVNEAATEDAQLFARREARAVQAKLELLRQGKEHQKFFKALGGIVITRSSRRSDFALSGRRHLGHVAFDEVDLASTSLCSAFVYIIARSDKLYLWKGKESGPDEVGCARLISMDLGMNAEIQEIDEGEEPSSFKRIVQGIPSRPSLSSRKPGSPSRAPPPPFRLFRIERERSKGLTSLWGRRSNSPSKDAKGVAHELRPFCQADLDAQNVYVVDCVSALFV